MNLFKLIWRDGQGFDSKVYEVLGNNNAVFALWITLVRANIPNTCIEIWDLDGHKQETTEKGFFEGLARINTYVYDPGMDY
jgi:hypothetical protein